MKADDYAAMYRAEPDQRKALIEIGSMFVRETAHLFTARNISDNSTAGLAVIREQSEKWKAFARRVNDGIREDGYLIIMRNEFPEIAKWI